MAKKIKTELLGMPWEFSSLFNEAIRSLPERPMMKRNYIYASELGGDFVSRYLKMHAHPYSNPFNDRSRRKMISGQIFEWIVYLILTMTGILKQKQLKGEVELKGMLRVSGKLDFVVGGEVVDWEAQRQEVKTIQKLFALSFSDMPPVIEHSLERVLFRMEQMFSRVPLRQYIFECKSVSGFVYSLIERTNVPRSGHPLQTLHYLIANNEPEGFIGYINRESFEYLQYPVVPTKELMKSYKQDIKTMTEYYNNSGKNYLKNMPPMEPEVVFEDATFRFVKNNHVEYSPYLTFLTSLKSIDEFAQKWAGELRAFNYAFKRCVKGENITDNNKQSIANAKKYFPEWDRLVAKAKAAGAFDKPEIEEE
jgi:hypothetical protein